MRRCSATVSSFGSKQNTENATVSLYFAEDSVLIERFVQLEKQPNPLRWGTRTWACSSDEHVFDMGEVRDQVSLSTVNTLFC